LIIYPHCRERFATRKDIREADETHSKTDGKTNVAPSEPTETYSNVQSPPEESSHLNNKPSKKITYTPREDFSLMLGNSSDEMNNDLEKSLWEESVKALDYDADISEKISEEEIQKPHDISYVLSNLKWKLQSEKRLLRFLLDNVTNYDCYPHSNNNNKNSQRGIIYSTVVKAVDEALTQLYV